MTYALSRILFTESPAIHPLTGEEMLVQTARHGDLEAFNSLVLMHQERVYNLAYRILGDETAAADATQEAFLLAYRHIGRFKQGSFFAWL